MLGIILQARMGSTRLPGKILMKIGKRTLLEHILFRIGCLKHDVRFVIATSTLPQDDIVAKFCTQYNVQCYRGSELNVLDRYYKCATAFKMTSIIRLTADNPFVDIEELDRLISLFRESNADYAHSFFSLPIGVGAEIFTYDALKASHKQGHEPHHLEHVNEYLLENPDLFKTVHLTVSPNKLRPDVRLTVDTVDDFNKANFIANNSSEDYITTEEAIRLCLQYA